MGELPFLLLSRGGRLSIYFRSKSFSGFSLSGDTMVEELKKKGIWPAVGLFFLAPLVAEFLLGNLPIKLLGALVVLAPMYGGGALLIRELVRRAGRGWPTMVILALAYGVVEEAFTTQTLFNPNYLHLNMHLLQPAYIPALGIGGWWTIFVLNLHMVWSISTSIALVEAAVPDRAEIPWLGRTGFIITIVLFVFGLVSNTLIGLHQDRFIPSDGQLAGAGFVCVLLVLVAFLHPRRDATAIAGWTPSPWLVGALALAAGSAVLLTPSRWNWGAAAAILGVDLVMAAVVLLWSQRTGWDMRHQLALGAGAAMAYGWHAFIEHPVIGGMSVTAVRIGNAIFALGAIALIVFAAKRSSDWLAGSVPTAPLRVDDGAP
jgi:hypothetical protein